jgi:hypothetical protein
MRIGDRARFETESREASEFDSPSHRWRDFPSLVKGLRWNRSVREDTSVQITLPPLRAEVIRRVVGDFRIAPPCQSGQTGTVESRVVSPSQVRILVAASGHHAGRQFPLKRYVAVPKWSTGSGSDPLA